MKNKPAAVDVLNKPLAIGDQVAFSDAGCMNVGIIEDIHIGRIQVSLSVRQLAHLSWPEARLVKVKNSRTTARLS